MKIGPDQLEAVTGGGIAEGRDDHRVVGRVASRREYRKRLAFLYDTTYGGQRGKKSLFADFKLHGDCSLKYRYIYLKSLLLLSPPSICGQLT